MGKKRTEMVQSHLKKKKKKKKIGGRKENTGEQN